MWSIWPVLKYIYMELLPPPYDVISPADSLATDIAFYDQTQNKVIIARVKDYSRLPKSLVPIGVVVVPGTHNVYGDGSCGVMSLRYMNYNTPDEGSINRQPICWGYYRTDLSSLHNYNNVCHVGINENVNETIQGKADYALLPSNQTSFNAIDNPYDMETRYRYNDNYYYAPSPYKNDGSFNPEYSRITSPSSTENALSDFDGVGNTKALCDIATSQPNWKTDSSIINNGDDDGYSPAACCCWRYHTDGTSQGDWYLPACGELGYTVVRLKKINETIEKLVTTYDGSLNFSVVHGLNFKTSSEYSSGYNRSISMDTGLVGSHHKEFGNYVRAFLRVDPNDIVR